MPKTLCCYSYRLFMFFLVNMLVYLFTGSASFAQAFPAIYINTNHANITRDEKVPAFMAITDKSFADSINIKGRGHSSWERFDKKPYSVELRSKLPMFGMPPNTDWALIANYSDKSFLRNKLAYYLGSRTMAWAPRQVFVEFYLDSVYQGLYSFNERVKQDVNRVNVAKDGFILEVDQRDRIDAGDTFFITKKTNFLFAFTYPKTKNLTTENYKNISSYVDSFEAALYGPNFKDPLDGYAKYIDLPSFIDYYIIQQHARNNDFFLSSTYFYREQTGKIFAGPLWDFDISYGNIFYNDHYKVEGINNSILWYPSLNQDPAFVEKVNRRLLELKPMFDSIPTMVQKWGDELYNSGAVNPQLYKMAHTWKICLAKLPPFSNYIPGRVRSFKRLERRTLQMDGACRQRKAGFNLPGS